MIEVVNLNKSFGKQHVLKDISFTIDNGEIVGFIGPNGSGKSTTMKCLVNLIFPDEGRIIINGHNLLKERSKAISNVNALIEEPGLYPNLSGIDNLKLFGELKKIKGERIQEVIKIIQLGNGIEKKTKGYSMGMKQRLALGIVLLSKPQYLILDEPFNGLDPNGVFDLRNILIDLAGKGHGIMISSHQLLELDKITTRNIFIKKGKIVNREDTIFDNSYSAYKISFANEGHPEEIFIEELINKGYITKHEFKDSIHLFYLSKNTALSNLLFQLLEKDLQINLLIPVGKDIEGLYQSIYN